jgi:hypothetical protein
MSTPARRLLKAELGGRFPDGLDTLTGEESTDFAERLRDIKQRQSLAL